MKENVRKATEEIIDLVKRNDISVLAFVFDKEDAGVVPLIKERHIEEEMKIVSDPTAGASCKVGLTLLGAMRQEQGDFLKSAITYASEEFLGHIKN